MKQFFLPADQIKRLIDPMGYCIASDRITVDGGKVGYMYREEGDDPADSGWRFFEGSEDQEYADDPSHFEIYDVNTIANYDTEIIPIWSRPSAVLLKEHHQGFRRFLKVLSHYLTNSAFYVKMP